MATTRRLLIGVLFASLCVALLIGMAACSGAGLEQTKDAPIPEENELAPTLAPATPTPTELPPTNTPTPEVRPTNTLEPGEYIVTDPGDLIGVWRAFYWGNDSYLQFFEDGTGIHDNYMERTGDGPMVMPLPVMNELAALYEWWFEEDHFLVRFVGGRMADWDRVGTYQIIAWSNERNIPVRLRLISIDDPENTRRQAFQADDWERVP